MPDVPRELGKTLETFNRLSSELAAGYRELEARAARLEAQLQDSQHQKLMLADRLSVLIDSLPGAVLVLDRHGRIRQANPTAAEWFGGQVSDSTWHEVLAGCEGRPADDAHELTLSNGMTISVHRSEVPGRRETIILLTDMTEQRRLQAELERNKRLATVGEMAARVAHQVRTPLSVASLYVAQITDRADDDVAGSARKIADQLDKLDRMTEDMLAFVRTGHAPASGFALASLADDVGNECGKIKPSQCAVRSSVASRIVEADPQLRGDRDALCGAICNLVENAWQAGADRVDVEFLPDDKRHDFILVRVSDNAGGIPAADRHSIFEPFVSGRSSGTGLGLAVARSTFNAHGGALQLEKSDARGSVFLAGLPMCERAENRGLPQSQEALA